MSGRGENLEPTPLYALNLFDLADNDLYRRYSRRSAEAVGKYGGKVVALGKLAGEEGDAGTPPRAAMILVEWPSREAFDAFLRDPEHRDLHPLREGGTRNYLWWLYDRLDDLRPLFEGARGDHAGDGSACDRRRITWSPGNRPGEGEG